jgi:hypothetical protein
MLDIQTITDLHWNTVELWHGQSSKNSDGDLASDFLKLVREQHRRNYDLWHEEDIARSPDVSDTEIARGKRSIDRLNQERNYHIEKLDAAIIDLLAHHGLPPKPYAPRNTETPGSVIDRLSIMSLRIYHMNEQVHRNDVSEEHRQKASQKLSRCLEQHHDLSQSLMELLDDLFSGRKVLKVYHQFKMYNDPTLNPYLYKRKAA